MAAERFGALASISFEDGVQASDDVSAIARVGDFLVIGADEAVGKGRTDNVVQVFAPHETEPNRYCWRGDVLLFRGEKKEELDIEGIAAEGDTLYVIGSHARKRPRTKAEDDYQENRETFHADSIEKEPSRRRLYRLRLDADGKLVPGSKSKISLAPLIKKDPVLRAFRKIPSKENGIDIEGIAAHGDWLTLGFRGPVLREGFVPVMRLTFDDPAGTAGLRYVRLGGRGIRDLVRVSDGFLVLAGPPGDGPGGYRIHHWDGRDMVPGRKRGGDKPGRCRLLAELALSGEAKAEGLALLEETKRYYELVVVFDGIENLLALHYRLARR